MKHIIVGIVLVISLVGCATTQNYEKILNSWLGAEVDDLVIDWGPPHNLSNLSDGGKVLEYHSEPGSATSCYSFGTCYTTHQACKTLFIVDSNGIITNWRWQGNACKAY